MTVPIQLSIVAEPTGQVSWTELARRCESIGARALLVPDHPGSSPSPQVALAAVASVTSTLRLSSYVTNAGVRHPLLLASDVATLDVVSDGRAELGIGAGHTPAEFEMTGRLRPPPQQRIENLLRVAAAVRELLAGGTVDASRLDAMTDVRLEAPQPVQARVPILVGGGNPALLDWAGAHADAVGLSGLGATLADGHSHTVRWTASDVDGQFARIRTAAAAARRQTPPPAEALVQFVRETDDRTSTIAEVSERVDALPEDVSDAPYALIGTIEQIVEQLHAAHERWGIARWAVREDALEVAEKVLAALRR